MYVFLNSREKDMKEKMSENTSNVRKYAIRCGVTLALLTAGIAVPTVVHHVGHPETVLAATNSNKNVSSFMISQISSRTGDSQTAVTVNNDTVLADNSAADSLNGKLSQTLNNETLNTDNMDLAEAKSEGLNYLRDYNNAVNDYVNSQHKAGKLSGDDANQILSMVDSIESVATRSVRNSKDVNTVKSNANNAIRAMELVASSEGDTVDGVKVNTTQVINANGKTDTSKSNGTISNGNLNTNSGDSNNNTKNNNESKAHQGGGQGSGVTPGSGSLSNNPGGNTGYNGDNGNGGTTNGNGQGQEQAPSKAQVFANVQAMEAWAKEYGNTSVDGSTVVTNVNDVQENGAKKGNDATMFVGDDSLNFVSDNKYQVKTGDQVRVTITSYSPKDSDEEGEVDFSKLEQTAQVKNTGSNGSANGANSNQQGANGGAQNGQQPGSQSQNGANGNAPTGSTIPQTGQSKVNAFLSAIGLSSIAGLSFFGLKKRQN